MQRNNLPAVCQLPCESAGPRSPRDVSPVYPFGVVLVGQVDCRVNYSSFTLAPPLLCFRLTFRSTSGQNFFNMLAASPRRVAWPSFDIAPDAVRLSL
jgi:hypothetical protein